MDIELYQSTASRLYAALVTTQSFTGHESFGEVTSRLASIAKLAVAATDFLIEEVEKNFDWEYGDTEVDMAGVDL